jgi:hypothetical protein
MTFKRLPPAAHTADPGRHSPAPAALTTAEPHRTLAVVVLRPQHALQDELELGPRRQVGRCVGRLWGVQEHAEVLSLRVVAGYDKQPPAGVGGEAGEEGRTQEAAPRQPSRSSLLYALPLCKSAAKPKTNARKTAPPPTRCRCLSQTSPSAPCSSWGEASRPPPTARQGSRPARASATLKLTQERLPGACGCALQFWPSPTAPVPGRAARSTRRRARAHARGPSPRSRCPLPRLVRQLSEHSHRISST